MVLVVLAILLLDLLLLGVRAVVALVVLGTTIEALVVTRRETTVLERAVRAVRAADSRFVEAASTSLGSLVIVLRLLLAVGVVVRLRLCFRFCFGLWLSLCLGLITLRWGALPVCLTSVVGGPGSARAPGPSQPGRPAVPMRPAWSL